MKQNNVLMYCNTIYIALIMNKLADIKNKYNVTNKELSTLFNVHPNTISNMLDKELINMPLSYIQLLKNMLDIPYNDLLGETIFTANNIDKQVVSNTSILDNDNEYQRLYDKLKADLKKELTKE